jgi:hypothetical protein
MVWNKTERRKGRGRRVDDDLNLCPFHKTKCDEIYRNRDRIDELKDSIVTRKEFEKMDIAIKSKAPRWVLVLFITTSVIVGGLVFNAILTGIKETHAEMKNVGENFWELKANQKILLQAFNITPISKQREVEDEEN